MAREESNATSEPSSGLTQRMRTHFSKNQTYPSKPADIKIGIILVPRATRFQVTRCHPIVLVFVAVRSRLLLPREQKKLILID